MNDNLSLTQKFTNVHYNRAAIYSDMGNYAKAVTNYSKAIDLEPDFAQAYYERGMTYEKLGQYDDALKDMEQYLVLMPQTPDKQAIDHHIQQLKGRISQAA